MSSHRRLVHRHMRRLLSKTKSDLLTGEARFYSFYQPSLQGGIHTITAKQKINAKGEEGTIQSDVQVVNIIAPRYSLAADVVDSVYPPPGESVPVTVLPHIVFKDPHMPWERSPNYINYAVEDKDYRNYPAWMALLVFTLDELQLEKTELDTILKPVGLAEEDAKQSETMTVKMRVRDTTKMDNVFNVIPFDVKCDAHDAEGPVDVLFMKKELFSSLFTTTDSKTSQSHLDVAQYKYMAHVRQVATDGMTSAGADEDTGLFSIVISPRTGPLGMDKAVTTVVHLVSLDMRGELSPTPNKDRVAMVSLHSWTYNCLPSEGDASPSARLLHLGENITVLSPQVSDKSHASSSIEEIITKRQQDGYTLVQHRTITGEVTAAIARGPLVPNPIQHPLRAGFTIQSNFGSDLQILDPKMSLMDISYALAWQLGKTLAMSDEAFSASLTRLRAVIHGSSFNESKIDVRNILGVHRSRKDTVLGMHGLVHGLNKLTERLMEQGDSATAVDANRWDYSHFRDGDEHVDISMKSPHIFTRIHGHADAAALASAQATDGTMYNEHNCPENTDFANVYSWVLDKLHLANVPAHYLLPDPSHLPQEALRFFYVDENWTDALVDGALSLANHWGDTPEDDFCRTAIKRTINKRLREPDPALGGWHTQMPRYGFILRSQLLVQFPDIAVTPKFAERRTRMVDGQPEAPKAPILVQKLLSADTMYCLFDCLPVDIESITFTMPPHQQRFIIGEDINKEKLRVSFRRIYTQPDHNKRCDKDFKSPIKHPDFLIKDGQVFDLDSRTMKIEPYVKEVRKTIKSVLKENDFSEDAETSALLALQLNETIPELLVVETLKPPSLVEDANSTRHTFQFALPEVTPRTPPPLKPRSRRSAPTYNALVRPRAPSPRREAALMAEYSARARDQPPRPPRALYEPKFDVKVYSLRHRTLPVPSNSPFALDLVFKIVRDPDSFIPLLPLTQIDIDIPYGDMPDEDGKTIPLLASDADPPVPTMLSNMRFNVLKSYSHQKGSQRPDEKNGLLKLKVVPRSSGGVIINQFTEASFLISRAKIVEWTTSETKTATIKMIYHYGTLQDPNNDDPAWEQPVLVDLAPL